MVTQGSLLPYTETLPYRSLCIYLYKLISILPTMPINRSSYPSPAGSVLSTSTDLQSQPQQGQSGQDLYQQATTTEQPTNHDGQMWSTNSYGTEV